MNYKQYREERQAKFNALPLFWAFSEEQLQREMEKRGVKEKSELCRFGSALCRKVDRDQVIAFLNEPDPIDDLMEKKAFAKSAFRYEMDNHEYAINWQGDWDVISAIYGEVEYHDEYSGVDYLRELGAGQATIEAYLEARASHLKYASNW